MMRSNARFWIGTIILGVFLIAWLMGEKHFPLGRFLRTLLHGFL